MSSSKFYDRYDLGQFRQAVEGTLEKLFKDGAPEHLDVRSVGHLATCLDKDGPNIKFLMFACLRETLGMDGPTSYKSSELLKEDSTVAAGMMRQLLAFNMDDERREFSAFYCPELKNWKAGSWTNEMAVEFAAFFDVYFKVKEDLDRAWDSRRCIQGSSCSE